MCHAMITKDPDQKRIDMDKIDALASKNKDCALLARTYFE